MKILGFLIIATVTLAGCAGPLTDPGGTAPSPSLSAPSSPAPSSIACPSIDATPLPPECIPYDPQALMDSNERYKERYPVSAESFAAFEAQREDITAAVEDLQASGELSPDSLQAILTEAGIGEGRDSAFAWADGDDIVFGGAGPQGGCVSGVATDSTLEMEVLGPIMDGGCTAAVGH